MQMLSTRGAAAVTPSMAILRGLAPDGGLYVPAAFPQFTLQEIASLASMPYVQRAHVVLSRFLPDFSAKELKDAIAGAYGTGFDCEAVAPLVRVGTRAHALELWHGPTLAFKDMQLQLLPHLLTLSARKNGEEREILILVATSGDTERPRWRAFWMCPARAAASSTPRMASARLQQMQMVTTGGRNTHVIAVKGNFDDAQSGVSASLPTRRLRQSSMLRARCSPRPTPSISAALCRRWCITSPVMPICSRRAALRPETRSTSACRRATLAISSRRITRARRGCLWAG